MRTRPNRWLTLAILPALIMTFALSTAPADAATYEIDAVHSSAIFKVKHFGVSNFYGAFAGVSGTIEYDAGSPEGLSIQVTIAADSVASRAENRDNHIKSPDFLNVAEFPSITFVSTSVTATGDGHYDVVGNLTLHGVTKEITVSAERVGEGEHPRSGKKMVGFETRFTVDRTEYDMGFMAGPLSAEVGFMLSLEAGAAE